MINVWTDGSYLKATGIGAWAYWIETPDNTYKSWGNFKAISASHAELYGIYMASYALCILPPQPMTIFWTDSLVAVNMLYRHRREYGDTEKTELRNETLRLINLFSSGHCFNYIPRNSTKQLKWCDKTANQTLNQ